MCASAVRAIVLAVCDYLAEISRLGCDRMRQLGPHVELAVITLIRKLMLDGFHRHQTATSVPPELLATAISWSIYGSAQEWARMQNGRSSEDMADIIMQLVAPTFALLHFEAN